MLSIISEFFPNLLFILCYTCPNGVSNIIAITDSAVSPIAPQSNQLLLARSDMASFVDSLVAPLSIINAIVVAVSRKKKDELAVRLRRLEQIWDEYDVYDKTHG